jgi:hypothetical protein
MQHENSFVFKLSASVGALLNLLGISFSSYPYFLEVHGFSSWIATLGLKLFELALAGLVTGFCGIAGKKFYERRFGKKTDGVKEEEDEEKKE